MRARPATRRDFLHLVDCDLYYEVTGSGPAPIFARGIGGNHISWWQQAPHFWYRYTCVTFAHRGLAPSKEGEAVQGLWRSWMIWRR